MRGNKGKRFFLELSFIGWGLLAAIPSGMISLLSSGDGFFSFLILIIAELPAILVYEYLYVSETAFYELLTERLVVTFPGAPTANTVETTYTVYEHEPKDTNTGVDNEIR